jgi:NCS1 family nucleobase:cation symporter-1
VSETFKTIYTYAWFIGVVIAAIVYGLMMKGRTAPRTVNSGANSRANNYPT